MLIFDIFIAGFAGFVWWSWAIFVVILFFLSTAIYHTKSRDWEEFGWSAILFAVMLGFMYSMAEGITITFASIITSVIVYTSLGIIWAFFKWTRVIIEAAKNGKEKPTVDKYKPAIIAWIAYFPISIALWVIIDLFHDFWEGVIATIKSVFNGWSDKLYTKYLPKEK